MTSDIRHKQIGLIQPILQKYAFLLLPSQRALYVNPLTVNREPFFKNVDCC